MENLDLNKILNRSEIEKSIEKIIANFSINNNTKKGIYIYGDNGIGKTKK